MKKIYAAFAVLFAFFALQVIDESKAGAIGTSCQAVSRNFDPNRMGPLSAVQMDWSVLNPTTWRLESLRIGPSAPWSSFPVYSSPAPRYYVALYRQTTLVQTSGAFNIQWNYNVEPEPNFFWNTSDHVASPGTVFYIDIFRDYNARWNLGVRYLCRVEGSI